ncbi:MAG TPA: beta-aspartyl-peptidase [Petrotogaceae bacterium]|nr:beta-aspartyl-peptidase [Petrotogaceae bacterium]
MILIKNADVYAPEHLGKKDLLIEGGVIGYIEDFIDEKKFPVDIQVMDACGNYLFPGLIDSHVHITGGGGEGGFTTKTPEILLSSIVQGGITTVVGCLGTDGFSRSMENLLSKAYALEDYGISTFIYSGSYQIPVLSLTGSYEKDIMFIQKILGVGEVALADHRSSQPDLQSFIKLAAGCRVAGILSGKAGIINVHVGDQKECIDYLFSVCENTQIPPSQFLPTHMNRSRKVLEQGILWTEKGGSIDLTSSSGEKDEDKKLSCAKVLKELLERKVPIGSITFSSDGQGSLPIFDEQKNFKGLSVGKVESLFEEVAKAVKLYNVPFETALKPVTENPAKVLKLKDRGCIECQKRADIVIADKQLCIETLICNGKVMMLEKKLMIKGNFE